MEYKIRYGNNNYREFNEPKWRWVRDKSGKISTFSNKEKAKQYIRNKFKSGIIYHDNVEIISCKKEN